MFDRFYEDLEVGATGTYGAIAVTEAQILGFAYLTDDHHPLHVDADFAARSPYGERIAQGFLVLSLALGVVPARAGAVVAMSGLDEVRFRRPTYIGDVLRTQLAVLDKTAKAVGGLVQFSLEILNQHGESVAVARLRMLMASNASTITPIRTRMQRR